MAASPLLVAVTLYPLLVRSLPMLVVKTTSSSTNKILDPFMVLPPLTLTLAFGRSRLLHRGRGLVGNRQREFRSLPDLTLHRDASAQSLHDAVTNGKTEPGSLPYPLGGEKGIEDLANDFLRNSGARIR